MTATRSNTRLLPSIRRLTLSKNEKKNLHSRTQGQLLLVSALSPIDEFGNLRKNLSEDHYPEVSCFDKNFKEKKIPNGSLVVSLGEIFFPADTNQYLLHVVSPLGFTGFVNVKFLYEIDQAILEDF